MPSFTDPSSPPFRTPEWTRLAIACLTNFALLAAPCQGFTDGSALPAGSPDDGMLLAALLLPELAVPMLDAGGAPLAAAPAPRAFPAWSTPPRRGCWRSPEPARLRPADLLTAWQAPAPRGSSAPSLILPTDPGPWQPGEIPAGSDPAPPAGNFGALPIEQEAGNCVVYGEVASGLEPVAKALVDIIGTGRVAETDAQGRFRIEGLPAGDFTAEASSLNHSPQTLGVSLNPTTPVELRFNLTVKPADNNSEEYTLEEESIVGEYSESSQGDFNLDLEVTPTLSSGLSSEDFAKAAVSDAGEAVEKISGANVVDGKFAVVRGLADRYVSTTFNGAAISSAVPSRKAVQLDLFPTSTLRGIEVAKLYSPDISGDFGGAAIDIRTKVFPDDQILDFKFKQEYNPSLPDKMLLPADTDLDYFGGLGETLNTGAITGPGGFLIGGAEAPDGSNGPDAEAARKAWSILHSNRTLIPALKDTEQKQSFGLTVGDTITLTDGIDFGLLVAGGAGGEDNFNESPILEQNGNSRYQEDYQRLREWNLFVAGGFKFGDQNEITATYFRKNITQHNVSKASEIQGGVFGDLESLERVRQFYGADANVLGNFYEIDPVEQDLEIKQISGKHQVGERGPTLRWGLTESDAIEDRPNYSLFRFTTLDFTADDKFQQVIDIENNRFFDQISSFFPNAPEFKTLDEAKSFLVTQGLPVELVDSLAQDVINQYPVINKELGQIDTLALSDFTGEAGPGNTSSRTAQSIKEHTEDQSVALDFPLYFDDDSEDRGINFGFGTSNLEKTRQSRGAIYDLVPEFLDPAGEHTFGLPGSVIIENGEEFAADPSLLLDYFSGYLVGSPYYEDNTLGGILNLINNVDGLHEITSHYFSTDLFLGDTFFRGGFRYESERRTAEILPPRPLLPPELLLPAPIEETVLLPSFSFGTGLYDGKLKLLGAWSRTTARPTFYEWLPTRSVDLSTGTLRIGNPSLENAQVEAFDLAADLAVNETSNLRFSLFKKKILDPIIEERRDPNTIGYSNGDEGNLNGAELEVEFREVGPFSLSTNLTYIDAELIYTVLSPTGDIVTTTERFPYQPEWIFNTNLGYEKEEWDLGVNLIYNFTGEYTTVLRRVGTDANLQQAALHGLDLVFRKGVARDGEKGLLFTAGIKNLVATDKEFTWQGGAPAIDGKLHKREEAQRTYFVEAKYNF
jgi:TonB-dependent receptor